MPEQAVVLLFSERAFNRTDNPPNSIVYHVEVAFCNICIDIALL